MSEITVADLKTPFSLSVFRILALGAAVCIATVHFTQPFLHILAESFNITKSQVSWVPTSTLLGYMCGIFFLTPLGDIISIRKLILIKLLVLAGSLFCAALTQNFSFFIVMCFLTGVCASSVQDFVPITAHLAPASRRGQVVGYVLTGMLLGSLLSRTVAGLITDFSSWRVTFAVYGCMVVSLWAISIRLIPDLLPTATARPLAIYKAMLNWCRTRPEILWLGIRHGLMGFCYSAFWVSLVFIMTSEPFNFKTSAVGYLAIPAVFGAFLGSWFGKRADQNGPRSNTLISAGIGLILFISMFFFRDTVFHMGIYGVLVVLGYQISLVTSQFEILGIDPRARSQLNAILLTMQFLFFSLGSYLSVLTFNIYGASGVAALGAGASMLSLVIAYFGPSFNVKVNELKS